MMNDAFDLTDYRTCDQQDFDDRREYEADLAAERAAWDEESYADDADDVAYADDWWAQQDGADGFYNGEDW